VTERRRGIQGEQWQAEIVFCGIQGQGGVVGSEGETDAGGASGSVDVYPDMIAQRKRQVCEGLAQVFSDSSAKRAEASEAQNNELHAKIRSVDHRARVFLAKASGR
jgi:hypothetical protein